jgi:hypothetical protein
MSSTRLILNVVLILGSLGAASAQTNEQPQPTPSPPEVSVVTGYCRELATFAKRNLNKARFFGDVAAYDQSGITLRKPPERWQEFRSQKARDAAMTGDNLYNTANVWMRNGNIVLADLQYGSPSGDWAQFVRYCFREDGSLAKMEDTFRTFAGPISTVKEKFYDSKGRRLRFLIRCYDLESGRKKRCDGNYSNYDADVFRRVQQLPVYALVRSGKVK